MSSDCRQSEESTGCVIFLIDESVAMEAHVAGGAKSRAEIISTALNSLLNQLTPMADLEVAVAGYRGDRAGGADIGCRWGGPLAGRRFVRCAELAAAPMTIENRVRHVPLPGGRGELREETVAFPIWYVPALGTAVFPLVGFGYCRQLLSSRLSAGVAWRKPPLVLSFVSDWHSQTSQETVQRLMGLQGPAGPPLVLHAHLGCSPGVPPTLCPSVDVHLPSEPARELFACASPLPEYMLTELRRVRVPVAPGARGLLYNAAMADLIRFLGVVKAYAATDRAPEGGSSSVDGTIAEQSRTG